MFTVATVVLIVMTIIFGARAKKMEDYEGRATATVIDIYSNAIEFYYNGVKYRVFPNYMSAFNRHQEGEKVDIKFDVNDPTKIMYVGDNIWTKAAVLSGIFAVVTMLIGIVCSVISFY